MSADENPSIARQTTLHNSSRAVVLPCVVHTLTVVSHHPLAGQGTVIRTGTVKMLEVARDYRCQNKTCGAVFSALSDMSQGNLLAPPVGTRTSVKH